jgi:hypothetical protein
MYALSRELLETLIGSHHCDLRSQTQVERAGGIGNGANL